MSVGQRSQETHEDVGSTRSNSARVSMKMKIKKKMKMKMMIIFMAVCIGALGAMTRPASADINLELRPNNQTVSLGDTISLGLYAVADDAGGQTFSAAQVILAWNTTYVQLQGFHSVGAIPLLSSGFFADPYGLNDSLLDGDGMWTGLAFLGNPALATFSGSLLATFEFSADSMTAPGGTLIDILASAGNPTGETIVFHGSIPNTPVTGTLSGATVHIVPGPAVAGLWLSVIALRGGRRRRRLCLSSCLC